MKGSFVISLDFELHWGGFEKWPLEAYRQYFINTREVIPKLLMQFDNYDLHVTWATVGLLFHTNKLPLVESLPNLKPSYTDTKLSAYNFMEAIKIGNDESEDPFHFAGSLVKQISNTKFQELGSHTFSHFYCNEPGQTVDQFRADLQAAQRSAVAVGNALRSLVFPRNQFNEEYLKVCFEEGFVAVRDNPRDWFWNIRSTQRESYWKRLNRGLDAYFPVGKENTYTMSSLVYREGFPVCIPASRLLRPYRPTEFYLNELKIKRIKAEMSRAAQRGEIYHVWWHPHNFGHYPKESMEGLTRILEHYSLCKERYGMQSLSMGEVADLVINKNR